jgi:CheY-like chemotaxis protein
MVVTSAVLKHVSVHRSAAMGLPIFSPASAAARPPILVVDDNPVESAATLTTLEAGGFAAVAESEGDAALRHARRSLTHLLVSELYVPCAEGDCVVRVLKGERARLPRLRVLVHTRHTSALDTEWALATGCDAVVAKGASPAVLVREVRRLEGFAA